MGVTEDAPGGYPPASDTGAQLTQGPKTSAATKRLEERRAKDSATKELIIDSVKAELIDCGIDPASFTKTDKVEAEVTVDFNPSSDQGKQFLFIRLSGIHVDAGIADKVSRFLTDLGKKTGIDNQPTVPGDFMLTPPNVDSYTLSSEKGVTTKLFANTLDMLATKVNKALSPENKIEAPQQAAVVGRG